MEPDHAAFEELLGYVTTFGSIGIPLLFVIATWLVWADRAIRHVKRVSDKILQLLENPENTGFGTVGMQDVVADNTRAIRGLSRMLRWFMERQSGDTMPPLEEEVP